MTTLAMDNYNGFISLDNFQASSAYERVWSRSLAGRFSFGSNSLSNRIDTALSVFLPSKDIVVQDRLSLEEYLANNSGVVNHIYELPTKVTEYFGISGMKIGMFSDPDTDDTPEMYFEILTELPVQEANSQLSLLNRNWILSGDEDLMKLNLTLKFI